MIMIDMPFTTLDKIVAYGLVVVVAVLLVVATVAFVDTWRHPHG